MSAYADLDLDTPASNARRRKLNKDIAAFADEARGRLSNVTAKSRDLASASSARAAAYARSAGDLARRRPVSTGLIAAAVGVGLVFLLSRTARSKALTAGEELWTRYARR